MSKFRVTRTRLVEQKRPQRIVGKVILEGREWYGITIHNDERMGPFPRQLPAGEAVYARFLTEEARSTRTSERRKEESRAAPKKAAEAAPQEAPSAPPPVQVLAETPAPVEVTSAPECDFEALIRGLDRAFKKIPERVWGLQVARERREKPPAMSRLGFGVDYGDDWAAFGATDGTRQVEYVVSLSCADEKAQGRLITSMHAAEVLLPLLTKAKNTCDLTVELSPGKGLRLTGDITGGLAGPRAIRAWGGNNVARRLVAGALDL